VETVQDFLRHVIGAFMNRIIVSLSQINIAFTVLYIREGRDSSGEEREESWLGGVIWTGVVDIKTSLLERTI